MEGEEIANVRRKRGIQQRASLLACLLLFAFLLPILSPITSTQTSERQAKALAYTERRPSDLPITEDPEDPEEEAGSWQPSLETTEDLYYVFDLERGGVLFEKGSEEVRQSPQVLTVMLSLLVLENIDLSRPLLISDEVASLSTSENILAVQLSAGLRYSPEFLLYSVLLYDSKAATRALAEALAGQEQTLLERMNQRARSIGMENTSFLLSGQGTGATIRANSTLQDLGLLMMQALSNTRFRQIYKTKQVIYTENMPRPAFLENRMKNAWAYSNDLFTGAMLAKDTFVYTTSYLAEGPDYSICILQGSTYTPNVSDYELLNPALREAVSVAELVFSSYERTLLVARGQRYGTIVQQDGITVELVYLDNVYTLRPSGQVDFEAELLPSVSANIPLPVEQGEVLGQVTFILPDGSRYMVAVGSPEDIFSQNTVLEQMLVAIRDYPEIVALAAMLAVILIVTVVVKVLVWALRTAILRRQTRRIHGRDRR